MFDNRIKTIQENLSAGEAFLVISDVNRFYYTGFHSSEGSVFICPDNATFLIDFRYIEKAKSVVKSCEVVLSSRDDNEICGLCKKYGITKLYLEADRTPLSRFTALRAALEGVEVSDSDKFDAITDGMREQKTKQELEYIKKAQEYTDKTFEYILTRIKPGITERELMLDMEFYMRKLGSEGISFDFIVVSGKNSSLPHGVPTDKVIENGDFVTMDFGAVYNGYRSDMTRTVAVGFATDEMKKVYETVLSAQLAAEKEISAGKVCFDIDKVARDIIYNAGYEGCFGHGLGHSVGIEIHEAPNFNTRCKKVLKEGTVMTVEPGIYLENKFGVRIEDMVYVTKEGSINLTNSKKELIIL